MVRRRRAAHPGPPPDVPRRRPDARLRRRPADPRGTGLLLVRAARAPRCAACGRCRGHLGPAGAGCSGSVGSSTGSWVSPEARRRLSAVAPCRGGYRGAVRARGRGCSVVDLFLLGAIGAAVFGGFRSGFIRRLFGLAFLGISFVLGAYLRAPAGAPRQRVLPEHPRAVRGHGRLLGGVQRPADRVQPVLVEDPVARRDARLSPADRQGPGRGLRWRSSRSSSSRPGS